MLPDENGGIRDLVSTLIQCTRRSSKGCHLEENLSLSRTETDAGRSSQQRYWLGGNPRDIQGYSGHSQGDGLSPPLRKSGEGLLTSAQDYLSYQTLLEKLESILFKAEHTCGVSPSPTARQDCIARHFS